MCKWLRVKRPSPLSSEQPVQPVQPAQSVAVEAPPHIVIPILKERPLPTIPEKVRMV